MMKHLLGGAAVLALLAGQPVEAGWFGEDGRRVIASGEMVNDDCPVAGFVNGKPVTFRVDTGNPVIAEFAASFVRKLDLKPGPYQEWLPGTRYGKVANATAREIRIGEVAWVNEQVRIYSNWRYAYGDDETPWLGFAALKSQGINIELDGNTCRLTVARSSAPAQCGAYTLSKLRGDETLRLCEGECAAVPFCRRLTER
jgi:hypothetical protein